MPRDAFRELLRADVAADVGGMTAAVVARGRVIWSVKGRRERRRKGRTSGWDLQRGRGAWFEAMGPTGYVRFCQFITIRIV